MSSRVIWKMQANQQSHPLFSLLFIFCSAFLKNTCMDEIYIVMRLYNKGYVLNGYISSIFYCFCLTRVTRKLESIPAAFRREVE